MRDLIVIGGGPAGLSAALNAAAEGLDTLVLERATRFGGQAATTSRIENYLGFPEGLSGPDLMQRAVAQAHRMGVELRAGEQVTGLMQHDGVWCVVCDDTLHYAKSVALCVGEDFRHMELPGDVPVLYGAMPDEHVRYAGREVAVVGGGNSAGQAVLSLAEHDAHVHLIARRELSETMSDYLRQRIRRARNVHVDVGQPVEAKDGCLVLSTGPTVCVEAAFAYVGTTPHTAFLRGVVDVDERGFVVPTDGGFTTNAPGLFVAGDVRRGSRKRVAAATGEGAQIAALAWTYIRNRKG